MYAAIGVAVVTGINILGTRPGKNVQVVVTILVVTAILALIAFGVASPVHDGATGNATAVTSDAGAALSLIHI